MDKATTVLSGPGHRPPPEPATSIQLGPDTVKLLETKFTDEARAKTSTELEELCSAFVRECAERVRDDEKVHARIVASALETFRYQTPSQWSRFAAVMGGTLFGAGIPYVLPAFLQDKASLSEVALGASLLGIGAFMVGTIVVRHR